MNVKLKNSKTSLFITGFLAVTCSLVLSCNSAKIDDSAKNRLIHPREYFFDLRENGEYIRLNREGVAARTLVYTSDFTKSLGPKMPKAGDTVTFSYRGFPDKEMKGTIYASLEVPKSRRKETKPEQHIVTSALKKHVFSQGKVSIVLPYDLDKVKLRLEYDNPEKYFSVLMMMENAREEKTFVQEEESNSLEISYETDLEPENISEQPEIVVENQEPVTEPEVSETEVTENELEMAVEENVFIKTVHPREYYFDIRDIDQYPKLKRPWKSKNLAYSVDFTKLAKYDLPKAGDKIIFKYKGFPNKDVPGTIYASIELPQDKDSEIINKSPVREFASELKKKEVFEGQVSFILTQDLEEVKLNLEYDNPEKYFYVFLTMENTIDSTDTKAELKALEKAEKNGLKIVEKTTEIVDDYKDIAIETDNNQPIIEIEEVQPIKEEEELAKTQKPEEEQKTTEQQEPQKEEIKEETPAPIEENKEIKEEAPIPVEPVEPAKKEAEPEKTEEELVENIEKSTEKTEEVKEEPKKQEDIKEKDSVEIIPLTDIEPAIELPEEKEEKQEPVKMGKTQEELFEEAKAALALEKAKLAEEQAKLEAEKKRMAEAEKARQEAEKERLIKEAKEKAAREEREQLERERLRQQQMLEETIEAATNKNVQRYEKEYLNDYATPGYTFDMEQEQHENKQIFENPNKADIFGKTLLMDAAKYGNDWKIKALITSGADVNMKDKEGWTALMYAVRYQGNMNCVELLIDAGADIKAENNYGMTALIITANYNNNPEILKKLLSYYSPNDKDVLKSFIQVLTENQDDEYMQIIKVNLFLGMSIPLNSFYNGKTPLMYAAESGKSTKVIKLLMEGSNTGIRSREGKTAFDYAKENPKLKHDDIYWSLNNK